MEISCKKDNLVKTLATVERGAATRDTAPYLTGVLMEARAQLRLVCTDLDLGIESLCEAEVRREGRNVVDARYLSSIIRKLPGDDVYLELLQDEPRLRIISGKSEFVIQTIPHEEFPHLPELPGDREFVVSQGCLRQMIRQTSFATVPDESRPFLSGVLVEVEGSKLRLVATDNARLAFREAPVAEQLTLPEGDPVDGPGKPAQDGAGGGEELLRAVVPGRSLQEVARLCEDPEAEVAVRIGSSHIMFSMQGTKVVSGLIESKYPDYRRVLLREADTLVTADRMELLEAVERSSLVARKGPSYVSLDMNEERIALSAREADFAQVYEEVSSKHSGPSVVVAYNPRFMMDMLRVAESDEVEILIKDPTKQSILRSPGDPSYMYVLMPVQL
ncbi:MAG: DNA polymerase III subunit beta [Firmicutes bacterium]|nr:DNA polymerase III subunit beta [Bacillota bacterium]